MSWGTIQEPADSIGCDNFPLPKNKINFTALVVPESWNHTLRDQNGEIRVKNTCFDWD